MSFSILIFYQVLSSESQNRARRETETEADFLMRKIVRAMNSAQDILQPAAGATSSVLVLNKYNFPQNPVGFDLSSGIALFSSAGGAWIPLTSGNVSVSQAVFSRIPSSGSRHEAVQIIFSVMASAPDQAIKASTTLQNTIYLP